MDTSLIFIDRALKALTHSRSGKSKDHFPASIPLMRTNYSGEIAAQGLYLGAWLFEKDPRLAQFYSEAMYEEFEHLDWCGRRVSELGGKVSIFNPVWFMGACMMGAVSQLGGSRYALGFVHETETQVLEHLKSHLERLPEEDKVSREIVEKMISDESSHAGEALHLGGKPLPSFIKEGMSSFGRILTSFSEWG